MKKGILYFIFLLLGFSPAYAQSRKIDSLTFILKNVNEDTLKVTALNTLSREFIKLSNYPPADSLAQKALQLSGKLNYKKGLAFAYANIGLIHFSNADYTEALKNQLLSLKTDSEIHYKPGMGSAYGNIGNIYESQGNYPEALQNHLRSLKIAEEVGNKQGVGNAHVNIGLIYQKQGNYPEALKSQQEAITIYEEIGNKYGMSYAYGNIGNIYEQQKNYPEAVKNLLQCLQIDKETNNKESMGLTYASIGNILEEEGRHDDALQNLVLALKMDKEIDNKYSMGYDYQNIGDFFYSRKNYPKAKQYLDSALILAKNMGDKEIMSHTSISLSLLDSALGNYKAAFEEFKTHTVYMDSLSNEVSTKKLVSEQMKFDFDKKLAEEKAEQDKKDVLTAADKRRQAIFTASVSIVLFLVLVFSGLLFSRFRVTQKQKKIIEEQKLVVEEKNKDILDSITYAKRLQDAILPPMSVIEKYLPESFVLYKPKDIVAGDFYWMERAGDVIFIAAADCTGHGVPGAMVSVVCSNALNRAVKEFHITEPGKILDKVRELVLETFEKSESNVQDGMDISLCCLNTKTKQAQWAGAYNYLWYVQNGEMKELPPDKQPIGKTDISKPFNTASLSLNKGDVLYLLTDGYADQFGGPNGKKFKNKQLQEKLHEISALSMQEQKQKLNNAFEEWKGILEQTDDVCIIGIRA